MSFDSRNLNNSGNDAYENNMGQNMESAAQHAGDIADNTNYGLNKARDVFNNHKSKNGNDDKGGSNNSFGKDNDSNKNNRNKDNSISSNSSDKNKNDGNKFNNNSSPTNGTNANKVGSGNASVGSTQTGTGAGTASASATEAGAGAGVAEAGAGAGTAGTGAATGAGAGTAGTGAVAGAGAGTVGTGAAAGATAGAEAGTAAGVSGFAIGGIVIGAIALLLVIIIIMSMFMNMLLLLSSVNNSEDNLDEYQISSEAEEILYVFQSFTTTSNDSDKSKYANILTQIKSNNYTTALCAVWKEIAMDYYYTNVSTAYENVWKDSTYINHSENEEKRYYNSAFDCAYDLYCGQFYLTRKAYAYFQMDFNSQGYKSAKSYIVYLSDNGGKDTSCHYHYVNNVIKMCLDAFVNPETGKVYDSPDNYLSTYKRDNKNKLKGKSENEIAEKCRNHQIRRVVKNFQGEDNLLEKCIIYVEQQSRNSPKKQISINKYIYINDGSIKTWKYDVKTHKFDKSIVKGIIEYDRNFSVSGDTSGICSLALGEIGNTGEKYWNNTNVWSGGANNWCAIFCAWLMEQSNIEPNSVGWNASCTAWINSAKTKGLYLPKGTFSPQVGDFIFFHYNKNDGYLANHVGIVVSVKGNNITTVEGNTGGNGCTTSLVSSNQYNLDSYLYIVGYIKMNINFFSTPISSSAITGLSPAVIDSSYTGHSIKLTSSERKKIEALVSNENSANGYTGCCLLAQCIRDAIYDGRAKAATVKRDMGYSASDTGTASENAKKAVKYIFDQGGYAVKHRILYMYNPSLCTSTWHESQLFIIEHGSGNKKIRYFDIKS